METTASKIATMLKNETFGATHVSVYIKHLIVQVEPSCLAGGLKKIQSAIALLIDKHFPLRIEDLSFLIKRTAQPDVLFTIYKPKHFTNLSGSAPLQDPDCTSSTIAN